MARGEREIRGQGFNSGQDCFIQFCPTTPGKSINPQQV